MDFTDKLGKNISTILFFICGWMLCFHETIRNIFLHALTPPFPTVFSLPDKSLAETPPPPAVHVKKYFEQLYETKKPIYLGIYTWQIISF